jgi:MFS family permease
MFSTFWILYLTSYVGTLIEDDEQVSKLYANLMLCSVTAGLCFSPLVGIFTDKVSPRVTIPISFLLRATGICLFYFINDPRHAYAFIVGTLMVIGTSSEQICSDAVLMRNADTQIRGVIYGTAVAFGFAGQLIFCLVGGWMFDNVGPKAPFYFVGVCDISVSLLTVILSCCGIIKNDITLRRQEAEETERKRKQIEDEIARSK